MGNNCVQCYLQSMSGLQHGNKDDPFFPCAGMLAILSVKLCQAESTHDIKHLSIQRKHQLITRRAGCPPASLYLVGGNLE